MNLLSLRNVAAAGALGIAGLGLVGLGAHAVFTQDATSSQVITAGTMNVVLSAPYAAGNGTQALQLAAYGPVGSSFSTGDQTITITNNGNVAVTGIGFSFGEGSSYGANTPSAYLDQQAQICVFKGSTIYNGPFAGFSPSSISDTINPGNTDTYVVNVYAGNTTTACGYSSSAPLTNAAIGGVIDPTITLTFTG